MIIAKDLQRSPVAAQDQFRKSISIQISKDRAPDKADALHGSAVLDIQFEFTVFLSIDARVGWFRVTGGDHTASHEQTQMTFSVKVSQSHWSSAPVGCTDNFFDFPAARLVCHDRSAGI